MAGTRLRSTNFRQKHQLTPSLLSDYQAARLLCRQLYAKSQYVVSRYLLVMERTVVDQLDSQLAEIQTPNDHTGASSQRRGGSFEVPGRQGTVQGVEMRYLRRLGSKVTVPTIEGTADQRYKTRASRVRGAKVTPGRQTLACLGAPRVNCP
ncbi:uncharacterized protein VDAG_09673 [Verticillium dahliae VdLs.17]|uniref:Uncharacterized protein n=1 Tax=Verticillium dahliae (strain VdLs.17 / ATCC MYA-4575 / FGSC 10137) TaxID=498257 RepID=G2XI23_VERDV|nr:uncharacterized protein VDAG_09673 [Verticillium dahliae VdLs.17]EGY19471.1 hypothetical protein VDAG_09673 [Verticillium dahliae VdLs.17]